MVVRRRNSIKHLKGSDLIMTILRLLCKLEDISLLLYGNINAP